MPLDHQNVIVSSQGCRDVKNFRGDSATFSRTLEKNIETSENSSKKLSRFLKTFRKSMSSKKKISSSGGQLAPTTTGCNNTPASRITNECITMSGKLLGGFTQSHNNALLQVEPEHAIFMGVAYPLTWIEDYAFYFDFNGRYWYYIRNQQKYDVIPCGSGYHQLVPLEQ